MNCRYLKYIFLLPLLAIVFSCSNKNELGLTGGNGFLRLNLDQDLEENLVSKSGEEAPVFAVEVKNLKTGIVVWSVADFSTLYGEPIKLKAGKYTVTAKTGNNLDAAFNSPFYSGETTIEVKAGAEVKSTIVCSLANVKVSATFAPNIIENFKDYSLVVNNGAEGELRYNKEDATLSSAGYFKCTGIIMWKLTLTNNNGEVFNLERVISNVKPKDHYRLNFRVDESGDTDQGGMNPGIVVDGSTNNKDYNINISLNKKPLPNVYGDGFDIDNQLFVQLNSSEKGVVICDSQTGISRIIISHNNPALLKAGIPYSFNIAKIDADTKHKINAAGIVWNETYKSGDLKVKLDFRSLIGTLALGNVLFDIDVVDVQSQLTAKIFDILVLPDVEVTTISVDPWAKFATLYAQYNTLEKPEGIGFQYKKTTESQWISVVDNIVVNGEDFSVKIVGLDPNTEYQFRSISTKDQSNIINFTTEKTEQMPNMSFDKWVKVGKSWYPNQDNGDNFWWDSGNEGANTISAKNPTSPEATNVAVAGPGKQAVKMQSIKVVGVLAAGNVYSGDFIKTDMASLSAIVSFGRPYTSRPLSLEGYYSYAPVAIDCAKDPYLSEKGKMDNCQIRVILADWSAPYQVNTATGNMINVDTDPNVIAYAIMESDENTGGYKKFKLDLTYKNNRKPKFCVISVSASRYGDYFTGGDGSTMFVDEFEFTF